MHLKEKEEIKELRDKIIRLETLIESEFKNLTEHFKCSQLEAKEFRLDIGVVYGKLHEYELKLQKVEAEGKRNTNQWKAIATIASPITTGIILSLINYFFMKGW